MSDVGAASNAAPISAFVSRWGRKAMLACWDVCCLLSAIDDGGGSAAALTSNVRRNAAVDTGPAVRLSGDTPRTLGNKLFKPCHGKALTLWRASSRSQSSRWPYHSETTSG